MRATLWCASVLVCVGCGGDAKSDSPGRAGSPTSGSAGDEAVGGGGATLQGGTAGTTNLGGSAGTSHAGATGTAGAAGSPDALNPPGATALGPYSVSTSYNGGGESSFELRFGKSTFAKDGEAWFVAEGRIMLGERLLISGGLWRLPAAAEISRDYFCPGPGATFGITTAVKPDETFSGCNGEPCTWKLVAPEPSWLACDPNGTGTLRLATSDAENALLESELPGLEKLDLKTGGLFNPAFGDPKSTTFRDKTGDQRFEIRFASTKAAAPLTWDLSDISIKYRASPFGDTQLICAAKGVYRVEGAMNELHTLEFTGVGSLQSCPGTPFGKPLVIDLSDDG